MDYRLIIAKQRRNLGISQEELAALLGAPVARIQKWESGEALPNLMQVPLLCAALQLSYDDFFSLKHSQRKRQHRRSSPIPMYQISYLPVMCNHTMQYYRLSNHMTTQDLAEKCSVPEQLVAKWESGRAIPKLDSIPVICRALHIRIWQFFE